MNHIQSPMMMPVECCIFLVRFLVTLLCVHSFIVRDAAKSTGTKTTAVIRVDTSPSLSSSSSSSWQHGGLVVVLSHRATLLLLRCSKQQQQQHHTVHGLDCVEIKLDMPIIGPVVVLEATAKAQETLVDLALVEDDDKEEDEDGIASEQQQPLMPQLSLPTGDPYGAVLWPASSSIASYLLWSDHPAELLHNKTILELGTGLGLVALAAAMGGAAHVLATDYEQIPLQLLEYAAQHLNPALQQLLQKNGTDHDDDDDANSILSTDLFDICDECSPLPISADVVVAADIMYEPKTGRCMARRAVEALRAGSIVLIGDSPGRAGRPAFLQELDRLGVIDASFVDVAGTSGTGERHELICGKESKTVSTAGQQPRELIVAIMKLDPAIHCPDK